MAREDTDKMRQSFWGIPELSVVSSKSGNATWVREWNNKWQLVNSNGLD